MWLQWTWWLASCERDFLLPEGTVPFEVWESLQKRKEGDQQ